MAAAITSPVAASEPAACQQIVSALSPDLVGQIAVLHSAIGVTETPVSSEPPHGLDGAEATVFHDLMESRNALSAALQEFRARVDVAERVLQACAAG